MGCDDRDRAFARLTVALDDQSNVQKQAAASRGTATELHTHTQLRAAAEQVAAREAWLAWMEREEWR
jgi:hypothetical protein